MDSRNTDNAPTPTETLSTLIEGYIKLRDARDVLKKEFEARTKGVTDAMEQLEGYMAQTLQDLLELTASPLLRAPATPVST